MKNLKQLKRESLTFLNKLPAEKLTEYECSKCHKPLKTIKPENTDVSKDKPYWDSLKTCYECGAQTFNRVYPNGEVVNIYTL